MLKDKHFNALNQILFIASALYVMHALSLSIIDTVTYTYLFPNLSQWSFSSSFLFIILIMCFAIIKDLRDIRLEVINMEDNAPGMSHSRRKKELEKFLHTITKET